MKILMPDEVKYEAMAMDLLPYSAFDAAPGCRAQTRYDIARALRRVALKADIYRLEWVTDVKHPEHRHQCIDVLMKLRRELAELDKNA